MSDFQTIDFKGFAELISNKDYTNEKVQSIKQQLWKACSEQGTIKHFVLKLTVLGFFYLSNHGVDQNIIDRLFSATREYFSQPKEIKQKDSISDLVGYGFLGKEHLSMKEPDYKETYNLRSDYRKSQQLPPIYEKNRVTLDAFTEQSWKLSRTLLTGIALTLGLEPDYFTQAHKDILEPVGGFRVVHYPPIQDKIDDNNFIRVGRHSDYGTFTLLYHETSTSERLESTPGLQVLSKNSETNGQENWQNIPAKPGSIIVNIADQLSLWTEGRFHSAVHRVIIHKGIPAKTSRYFIGYFVNPDIDYKLYPIPSSIPAPHPAIETSDGVLKASFGEFEFIYGDTSDNYFLRRLALTYNIKK